MTQTEELPVPRYEVSIIGGWAIVSAIDESGQGHHIGEFPNWHAAERYCQQSGYGKLIHQPGGFAMVRGGG